MPRADTARARQTASERARQTASPHAGARHAATPDPRIPQRNAGDGRPATRADRRGTFATGRGIRTRPGTSRPAPPRRQRARRRSFAWPTPLIAIAALAATLVFGGVSALLLPTRAGITAENEVPLLDLPVKSSGQLGTSTPPSEWQQGTMPHLYQYDPVWAEQPYAGGTIRLNACGPTCLTMVYVYLTGRTDYTPLTMARFADANNYAPTGATEWAFMTEGAARLGLSSTELNPHDTASVIRELRAGRPIIASVAPGDFTTTGHYIVLCGIDDTNQVTVYDPNSSYRSAQHWGITRVLMQTQMCWSFTA